MGQEAKLTPLGKLVIGLFLGGCVAGGGFLIYHAQSRHPSGPAQTSGSWDEKTKTGGEPNRPAVAFGIAYGTEKETWLRYAVDAFAKTPEGQNIKINLVPMGSLEGAQAVWRDQDKRIHVWSPASSLYKETFVQDWQANRGGNNPILKEESLALSPMVFVMWKERYDAFVLKYKAVSFTTIAQAMQEPEGWGGIAKQPQWGLFKFGHTDPARSNSGLMTLALMAYDFHAKDKNLSPQDITNPEFQARLEVIERGLSGMSNSTGNMMKDMVSRGPSTYDALLVYESVAIDYLKPAEGRYGKLQVVYPPFNMWSDNPYYILDVPWSSPEQQQAAQVFLDFLRSDAVQKEALHHGFRPGDLNVPIRDVPDSPFDKFKSLGLEINPPVTCKPPSGDVVRNLLISAARLQGGR